MIPKTKDVIKFDDQNLAILKDILDKIHRLAISRYDQQSAITAGLTAITHTDPGTPDYAIQDLTTTTPYGFVTKDEGNTVLKVIANLQARVDAIEDALQALDLLG